MFLTRTKTGLFAAVLSGLLVGGCGGGSDSTQEPEQQAVRATSAVLLGVNLPEAASVMDTALFNPAQSETYTGVMTTPICDAEGGTHVLTIYVLKSDGDANAWDAYSFIDEMPVDIVDGVVGANGQYAMRLAFDAGGALAQQNPAPAVTEAVLFDGANASQTLLIDFFTANETTQSADPFAVNLLQHDGNC